MANVKIMIVESNSLIAEDIEERLQTLGYTICAVASSRAEAVAKAAEMRPDLVLINTELEGQLRGIEVAQDISNRFNMPVVYLIDSINADLLEKVKMGREFGYVFKPYETNQLHLIIESQLYRYEEDQKTMDEEQQRSTILNNIGDAVIATDEGGFVTFMNPVAEILTGWPLEEACGEYITHIFNVSIGESNRSIRTSLMNVLHRGVTLQWGLSVARDNAYLNTKSDLKIVIDYNAAPLKDTKRNIVGMAVTFRDMRKHKEIENRLEQTITELENQNQLMETVFSSISDGIIVIDPMGIPLLANPSAEQIFGMPPQEINPSEWAEKYGIFYSDQKTPIMPDQMPVIQALRGKVLEECEFFIRNKERPDGVYARGRAVPLLDGNREIRGSVAIIRDITKDKKAAAQLEQTITELQHQNQLMDTIFNSISDGVVVTDRKGNFLLVNPSAERIVGMGATEAIPDEWAEKYGTFYPDQVTPFPSDQLPLVHAMQGRATDAIDLFIRNQENPDGSFINVYGRPLQDRKKEVRGGVIVFRDVTKIKRTEARLEQTIDELEKQAQLMDTIFDNMSDGVVVADDKGEYIMANPAAEKMIGQNFEELNLPQASEQYGLFDPTTGALFPVDQLPLALAIKGKATNNVEMRVNSEKLSQEVYVSVNGRPLLDKKGILRGGVAVARDITQLKKTEIQLEQTVNELQNQTQLMKAVFNHMSDGVILADKEGQYIMANRTAEQMTGRSLQQPVGISNAVELYGFFLPDEKTPFPADQLPIARALRCEPADNIRMFVYNPSVMREGIHLSVSARLLYGAQGAVTGSVSVSRDVTELRQAETNLKYMVEQLKEQGALLESIFNSISDGVVVADANGNFTIFNPSAERIVGMGATPTDPDEWSDTYGLFFPDRVTPFPADELPLARAIKGEISDEVEMFVRNPNVPEGVFISVSGRPLQDEAGSGKGGVIVFRDVTQRMIAEEALTQAFAQGRLEIVDTILHNIGNAINSVTSGVEMLHRELKDNPLIRRLAALASAIKAREDDWIDYIKNDPQGQQVLPFICAIAADFNNQNNRWLQRTERIKLRATHIADIVITQKSFGNSSIVRKDVSIYKMIDDALKLQQESINKKGIQIDIDCEKAPQEIRVQESQFHQMLVNLIKNSIEAIDELVQSGGLNEKPHIHIRTYINGDFYCLEVIDNGIGIKPENSKLIFAAGYTTKKSGSGLGLHSIANFVIASGGQIQPLSEGIGKGMTMRVMLRLASILP